jgi:hypothetical protein
MATFRRLVLLTVLLAVGAGAEAQVVLRLAASNPSKIASTEVELKKLLPERIERADVLDADGMDIVYDADAKRYSVRKTVELAPEERVVFTVELRDIWVFNEDELGAIKERAAEIREILAPTRASEKAALLQERIAENVDDIFELQGRTGIDDVPVTEHISAYDRNEVRFEAIQDDIRTLEAVLQIVGDSMIIEDFPDGVPPNVGTLWKVILVVVSFIGALTVVFFFIWSGQLKRIRQAEREAGISAG